MTVKHWDEADIDRISPTRRPTGRRAMHQNWWDLLFLHWPVPAEMIRPLLPPQLELDLYEGMAYIGLVPFTMTGVRPIWLPSIPGLSDFHEINVRTYVHSKGGRPGVWFFSLDAASAIAVRAARALWKLPYHYAEMSLIKSYPDDMKSANPQIDYKSERLWPGPLPANCEVGYSVTGEAAPAEPGTLLHFLAERYILYTYSNDKLYSGQVNHTPYPLQAAKVNYLRENLVLAAGISHKDEEPLAHYASGVNVNIFPLRRVE